MRTVTLLFSATRDQHVTANRSENFICDFENLISRICSN